MLDDRAGERLLVLALEELRGGELPQLLANEIWNLPCMILLQLPTLLRVVVELDFYGLAMAQLRAVGRPADWMVCSHTLLQQPQPSAGSLRNTL